jgi:glutamate--cysteine ligase
VSLALQPVATALFAASPFTEAKPNGFLSFRSEIWRDTDPDRTGMLPFAFDAGFGFAAYVDYALDVPMYFVYRDGSYVDTSGASFRDFMQGKLAALPGERPNMADWSDHLTTLFPEVRMKRFLEMRGADGGPWWRICAVPALWTGLLYDAAALEAAWKLVADWSAEERQTLRDAVPKLALKTPFRKGTVQDVAREMVAIARSGLKARANRDTTGEDEGLFLDTVERTVEEGRTPAEELLQEYEKDWGGDIDPIFEQHAF